MSPESGSGTVRQQKLDGTAQAEFPQETNPGLHAWPLGGTTHPPSIAESSAVEAGASSTLLSCCTLASEVAPIARELPHASTLTATRVESHKGQCAMGCFKSAFRLRRGSSLPDGHSIPQRHQLLSGFLPTELAISAIFAAQSPANPAPATPEPQRPVDDRVPVGSSRSTRDANRAAAAPTAPTRGAPASAAPRAPPGSARCSLLAPASNPRPLGSPPKPGARVPRGAR